MGRASDEAYPRIKVGRVEGRGWGEDEDEDNASAALISGG